MNGVVQKRDKIKLMAMGVNYDVNRIGTFAPEMVDCEELAAGEVGYIICGIKSLQDAKVGDTITHRVNPSDEPLPGFADVKPMVFSGIFQRGGKFPTI